MKGKKVIATVASVVSVATPWYSDWTFWTMAVAVIALILSQFPPLIQLIKKSRLDLEPYNIISITHTMGNPNATLYIAIHNVGGRDIKINSIELIFKHADGDTFTIPAQAYFPTLESKSSVIMPPFKIKAQESWEHSVQFYKRFNREDDKLFRLIGSEIRSDIASKKEAIGDKNILVEANPNLLSPAFDFFNAKNKWKAGEYTLSISIKANPQKASITKSIRFTLFETDANNLISYLEDYKYGLGVYYYNIDQHPGVFIPLLAS